MNNERTEDNLLKQVDDLLDHGTASDHALVNELASTMPDADPDFQEQLEERLVAMLENKTTHHKAQDESYVTLKSITPMTRRPARAFPYARWVAVVVMMLAGAYLLKLYQQGNPEMAIPLPVDAREHTIVVAAKYITEGDLISESTVETVTLDAELFAKLQHSYPGETFYVDVSQVMGKRAMLPLNPLEPVLPASLDLQRCPPHPVCIPPDIYNINLPVPDIEMEKFGITIGDQVDVYVDINNQSPMILDVRLSDVQGDYITLTVSAWKYALLDWHLRIEDKSYFLRPHQESRPQGWNDLALVEYTLRTLTPLDEQTKFYLDVSFPLSHARILDGPASLELLRGWINYDWVHFQFSSLEFVRRENESTYILRMPKAYAANLDYLLSMGGELTVLSEETLVATPLPTEASSLPAAITPTATLEDDALLCPQGLTYCVPLPEGYDEVMLPLPQAVVQDLKPGDRVDVLTAQGTNYSPLVENVVLLREQVDGVALAAPSYKHTILSWFLEQEKAYTLRLSEDNVPVDWNETYIPYTLEASEPLPENYQFDLIARIPYSQGALLATVPNTLDRMPFTANGNTMSFWFKRIRTIRTDGMTAYVEMPFSEAENLKALIYLGAELVFQPDANPPTATPTSISGTIPSGRVAMSLPVKELPPRPDQMDVLLTLPETNISMSEEDRKAIQDTEHFRINNGIWEFRFTDMGILEIHGSGSPESSSGEVTVTFHVAPQDAPILEYLLQIGAEVQFAPKIDEALSENAMVVTTVPEIAVEPVTPLSEPEVCMELMECRRNLYYYKINLPRSQVTIPDTLSKGDQVTIEFPSQEATIEDLVLVAVNDETVILAAPAWKYSLLLWLSQSEGTASYIISPFDGVRETEVVEPLASTTMTFTTEDYVPEKFQLTVTLPQTQISRLIDLPYYGIRSSLQNASLSFSFPDIERVSQNEDSYTIRLPAGDAANLEYLLSLGAQTMVFMESQYLPTFTPTVEASGEVQAPYPTFTMTPDDSPAYMAAIPTPIANRPCPPEAQYCVTVPKGYAQIRLPIPRIPATGLWFEAGDRVNLWLSPNDQDRLILENVLFVGTEMDTLIFAAPAWKYAVLYAFLGSGESTEYTMRPYDGTDFPILATSDMPTMYTLNNLHVPFEIFDLRVKVPPSQIKQLAAMPHLVSSIDSMISEGALYFYFPRIEKRSTNSDSSSVIALSSDQAAALDYLRTIGGEMDVSLPLNEEANPPATFTPTLTPMSTFTPVATLTPVFLPEGATLIPQDRVAMSLPAGDALPDAEALDIIVSLPHGQTDVLQSMTYSYNHIPVQINLQTWDMRFTDVEVIDIYEPGTIDPALDETVVSFHVRRADASILQNLVDQGAAIKFVPSN